MNAKIDAKQRPNLSLSRDEIQATPCPTCGALAGARCPKQSWPHKRRESAAVREVMRAAGWTDKDEREYQRRKDDERRRVQFESERQAEERRSREWPDGFPYECLDHWTDHIPDNGDRQWIMWTNRPDSQFKHDSHFISTITRLEKSGRYRWQVDGSLGQGVTWTIDEGFAATLSAAKAKAEKVEAKAAAEAQEEAGKALEEAGKALHELDAAPRSPRTRKPAGA